MSIPTERILLNEEPPVSLSNKQQQDKMLARVVTQSSLVLDDSSAVLASAILNMSLEEKEDERVPVVSITYTQKSPGRGPANETLATFCALTIMRDTLTAELAERRAEFVAAAALAQTDTSNPQ